MYKAKLFFQIDLKYDRKAYHPLRLYGTYQWNKSRKVYEWIFPLDAIKDVMAVLGKPIAVSGEEAHLVEKVFVNKKKKVIEGKKQGEGFIRVALHPTLPNYFQVTTVRERKPQTTNVAFDTVKALWKVVKKQPLNKKILTHTIAQNYCNELKITAFHTNEKFNWKYFSGSRKYYLVFYAAIKVLAHFGVVEHIIAASKSGIKRIEDKWDIQTEL